MILSHLHHLSVPIIHINKCNIHPSFAKAFLLPVHCSHCAALRAAAAAGCPERRSAVSADATRERWARFSSFGAFCGRSPLRYLPRIARVLAEALFAPRQSRHVPLIKSKSRLIRTHWRMNESERKENAHHFTAAFCLGLPIFLTNLIPFEINNRRFPWVHFGSVQQTMQ